MAKMSEYAFVASILSTALATLFYLMYAISGLRAARMETAGMGVTSGAMGLVSGPRTAAIGRYATMLGWLATIALFASMAFRAVVTGHGPFANMYEFSMAFGFGILVSYMWFERKYHQRILALVALPVALIMMLYAATIPANIEPLVPALQNNLLLTVHVAVAIVAYGSFAIAFASSLLYLLQGVWTMAAAGMLAGGVIAAVAGAILGGVTGALGGMVTGGVLGGVLGGISRWAGVGAGTSEAAGGRWGLPKPQVLDEIGYRAVVVGFPFLTLTIILGAVWADTAWGSYWSWDPKETASLVTWFIYGSYLHARVMRGWRGDRAAWLLVFGFAATIFTYFGNLFFGGLHSYSGLNN
ncbi:MAG: c-type cytochrome biogenesis protein CcsB [Chloroflexota bacterium]